MTYFQMMFMFIELFICRILISKKYSNATVLEFRHRMMNYIYNTDGLKEFNVHFSTNYMSLGGDIYKISRDFKRYFDKVFREWSKELSYK